ncbi:hypothetical protein GKE82_26280 [Conexibacter sp. W3-3-2]|uniref:hypothetical protein n=1 Tax=Conexibacter sp. W3-3-2 TaxID=2675227 RepID=UPI0012B90371|nr:hypothetical protein [Conexibacter sp. W3-3-2]MTD47629.1 hypothetical protein [Conexibacter sp. W3-3-2]MTD47714.1 hypothetical protein [Conexibacter sp. W3-3-2]
MKTNRRDLFKLGAITAVGHAIATPGSASASGVDGFHSGTFRSLESAESASVELVGGQAVVVHLAPGCEVLHGLAGDVADLTDFVTGEEVVFASDSVDDAIVYATVFQSMASAVTTTIKRSDDEELGTSAGTFAVNESVGDPADQSGRAVITYWTDPQDGARYANAVNDVRK